eukprot:evm.model.NODE_12539_length_10647_cov_21.244482.4
MEEKEQIGRAAFSSSSSSSGSTQQQQLQRPQKHRTKATFSEAVTLTARDESLSGASGDTCSALKTTAAAVAAAAAGEGKNTNTSTLFQRVNTAGNDDNDEDESILEITWS